MLDGRLVRLCCPGCTKKARKQSKETLGEISKALVEAKGNRAGKCPVSGRAVEPGKGVNMVHGTTVVRLCCKNCIAKFDASPATADLRIAAVEDCRRPLVGASRGSSGVWRSTSP